MAAKTEKKVLLYSHGELLGDALLKLPSLSVLKSAFPDHKIIWCSGRGHSFYANVLAPLVDGYVDEVLEDIKLGHSWKELFHRPQTDEYYDVIIDTQSIMRSTVLLKRVSHGSFISSSASFLFSDKKPKNKAAMFSGSIQQRLLNLIRLASGKEVNIDFHLNLPDKYRQVAQKLLPDGPDYIGFAPGSGVLKKCWPQDRYIAVAKEQLRRKRTPVFFLGPNENDLFKILKQAVPEALYPEQENTGKEARGPLLSIALAERIMVGVANDSGTGHIMSISGSPLISLFGHSNVEKFVHYGKNRRVLEAKQFGGVEMHRIPLQAVVDEIDNILL